MRRNLRHFLLAALNACGLCTATAGADAPRALDFNRDIRPILSNACFKCHGPDEKERQGSKGGLRLDTFEGATADRGAATAIVPGKPGASELIRRVTTTDPSDAMPPPGSGKRLGPTEVETLSRWIRAGATYARHWAYVAPVRPPVPAVHGDPSWLHNPIDAFILQRLEREGLSPSPPADLHALARRAALDATGLPPSIEDVDRLIADTELGAYERYVDRLLDRQSYGEHWARLWLDQARYADSAGYADDPPRTIWAYRDYVIRAFNDNKPFDRFTIEQIAGDLLPNPTEEQLVATAFHRNTLTNNEGGTSDEEFRNVAIVDRVNTTMAVWMGTTINCSQCHSHKYDPLSQEEFFQLFAFFNNTQDADRPDESPVLELWSEEDRRQQGALRDEIARLKKVLGTSTPELGAAQAAWAASLGAEPAWRSAAPTAVSLRSGAVATIDADGTVRVPGGQKQETTTVEVPLAGLERLAAIRVEALPDPSLPGGGPGHAGGNFVVSGVRAALVGGAAPPAGRFVRVTLPGKGKFLSLAEVQVLAGGRNVAPQGTPTQSSTDFEGPAALAIDGNTNGDYNVRSTTHTALGDDPWWELDLGEERAVERIAIWNRTDSALEGRLEGFRVALLRADRSVAWESEAQAAPRPSAELEPGGPRPLPLAAAHADFSQSGFPAATVLDAGAKGDKGWAIAPQLGKAHSLTLVPASAMPLEAGTALRLTIEHLSKHEGHILGRLRIHLASEAAAAARAATPAAILAIVATPAADRSEAQRAELERHFLGIAPQLQPDRERLAAVEGQLAALKPRTTVPVMREVPAAQRRSTRVQMRGNFLDLGAEVSAGVPAALHPLAEGAPRDRLALARWLVDRANPLTARVVVNRVWEAVFGVGLVRTSEEFGTQGEPPSHPELLDWLAVDLQESGWDLKRLVRQLLTSAAYRQSSRVTPEAFERDPENRLLARGPRVRLSAEMVRDQALASSGLLSARLHGPPVKPPQPSLGLSAAFGSGIDWETSPGEDRHRRALYTTWRRSNPYPSMAAFDAPNREVCTLNRTRTNTPLQALVTLNDPVYVEAAQALGRLAAAAPGDDAAKLRLAFRRCLARPPADGELARLAALLEKARDRFRADPASAVKMATVPIGPAPPGADAVELAAWTVVSNVLLNLDELFLKR